MDEQENKQDLQPAVVSMLTTEHFTLQTARSSTVSEANGRTASYLSSLSRAMLALTLLGTFTKLGPPFTLVALVLTPSKFLLGIVTSLRVLESGIEGSLYVRAIYRIRHRYLEAAPELRPTFLLSAHDDAAGVMHNQAVCLAEFSEPKDDARGLCCLNCNASKLRGSGRPVRVSR